jgi:hypothetical protein
MAPTLAKSRTSRPACAVFARAALLALVLPGCAQRNIKNPLTEYLAGMSDAVERVQPAHVPTLIMTWDLQRNELGQCKRIDGEPVIYVHVGRIREQTRSVEEARELIAEVLAHELGHAQLTCSDRDHAVLARVTPRTRVVDPPTRLNISYAWEGKALR